MGYAKGDPFWITTKYPTRCANSRCGMFIKVGSRAYSWPKGERGKKCYCTECGKQAEREFLAACQDEDFYNGEY